MNPLKPYLLVLMSLTIVGGTLGCSSTQVKETEARRSSETYEDVKKLIQESHVIAPGNVLLIDHSGDSKISGTYNVDFEGKIQMPYKVTLSAAGLKSTELREAVLKAYQPFVRGSSSVDVEIKSNKVLVEVRGEVQKPGRYLVRMDVSLEELVAQAGGFGTGETAVKRPEYLGLERPNFKPMSDTPKYSIWFHLEEFFFEFDSEPDFLWRGGEKLFFQRTAPANANIKNNWQTITVMGEVKESKDLPVLPNADLMTYVSHAGGVTAGADLSMVEIVHRDTNTRETVDLLSHRKVNPLRAGDVMLIRAIDTRPSLIDRIASYALTLATITLSVATVIIIF